MVGDVGPLWVTRVSHQLFARGERSGEGGGGPAAGVEGAVRRRGNRKCEGVGDVVGVATPLGGVAQVIFHGVKVVEVGVVLRVHQDRKEEEDGEGQVEVEREEGEVREKRSCVRMG